MHHVPDFEPKTGKLFHVHDPRTLILEDYTATAEWGQQPLETSLDNGPKVQVGWPMYGNDQYGDCTCAGIAHIQEVFDALVGKQNKPGDNEPVVAYEQITGFNPGPPPQNDNGASMIDVLNWWRRNPMGGSQIFAYSEISEPSNLDLIKRCIRTFGASYVGLALPRTVMQQFRSGQPWDVVSGAGADNGPGTLGGHAIEYHGWNEQGFIGVSWGQVILVTYNFHCVYSDEMWAPLSAEWEASPPPGITWEDLQSDLQAVTK